MIDEKAWLAYSKWMWEQENDRIYCEIMQADFERDYYANLEKEMWEEAERQEAIEHAKRELWEEEFGNS